ncbi:MAG TPA: hypothetical protein VFZ66_23765 [Herpetosiphonaceae bacterium]
MIDSTRRNDALGIVGAILVVLGGLFLVAQLFDLNIWGVAWPFFVILPGLLCFVAMFLGGRSAGPLAIPGSIITTVGLILLYQTITNHFESWAYAWTLIPTAVGVGMLIDGSIRDLPKSIEGGKGLVRVGLIMFLVGITFFELVIDISGRTNSLLRGIVGPLLLIAGGIYLFFRRARPAAEQDSTQAQEASPLAAPIEPTSIDLSQPPPPPIQPTVEPAAQERAVGEHAAS